MIFCFSFFFFLISSTAISSPFLLFFNINYSVFSSFSYLLPWLWTGHFLSFVLHLFLFHTVLLQNYRNKTNIFWMSNYSFTFSFFRSSFFLFSFIFFNFCFLSFHFLIIFYFFIRIYFPQIRIPLKDSVIGYW